ncbi:nucleotidyltransferase family protein [Thermus filiformis]|uniref:DNA polymerase n=1 Tax=Thermus filiformis TaxID=276 RepID=A0A0A2WVN0_THEFI|nr:nucleotidyltransferase family protein [Thermus filiformis]KGQ22365.2 DNA polymerase [Thermus filiformis]
MKSLAEIRRILQEHKDLLQERFGVKRLAIFGSYARGEATPVSDVDILVDLEGPVGWEVVDLHDYLEALLGVRVDLVTEGALRRKPALWEEVREDLIHV